MNGDPYIGIINELKDKRHTESHIGKVIQSSPICIAYRGIEFDSDEILMNADLTGITPGDNVFCAEAGDKIVVVCRLTN